jgi:hypothetical protein
MSQFAISDENPNVFVGGGGTLTSGDQGSTDDKGPFVIFPAVATDSNISPHAVLSYDAVCEIYAALTGVQAEAEEPEVIELPDSEVEEVTEPETSEDEIPVI